MSVVLVPKPEPTPDSWYITRRDAILDGDEGLLPAGYTCVEQRIEYSDMAVAAATPPAATLASIAPTSATVGGADFTLQAIGTNFADGDQIVFNLNAVSTTYVSATELDAAMVGASLVAGSFPVSVRRGATDTAPINFIVS